MDNVDTQDLAEVGGDFPEHLVWLGYSDTVARLVKAKRSSQFGDHADLCAGAGGSPEIDGYAVGGLVVQGT
ncbi:MAG TPA: hypothetical protein PLT20_01855 [Sedimentisphaerales bacterium]|nr:hypothetical protein [Sedimentisphaerales bacterium]